MQAIDDSLTHFLNRSQQFTIPIFQRKYDWTKRECKQLFEDIKMIGESPNETHFLGSIVHLNDKHNTIPIYRVIDGQQRLTTIALLISALAKFLKKHDIEDMEITSEKLIYYYLINVTEEGDLKYKIKLNNPDNKTLHKVIDYTIAEQETMITSPNDSKRIWQNYNFFYNAINENNAKTIYDGFLKLSLIIIKLDEHSDNPQLIFESLNYKGLSLSKSDLIRNYVLMGLNPEQQDKIYEDSAYTPLLYSYADNFSFCKDAYYIWDKRKQKTLGTATTMHRNENADNVWKTFIYAHSYPIYNGCEKHKKLCDYACFKRLIESYDKFNTPSPLLDYWNEKLTELINKEKLYENALIMADNHLSDIVNRLKLNN